MRNKEYSKLLKKDPNTCSIKLLPSKALFFFGILSSSIVILIGFSTFNHFIPIAILFVVVGMVMLIRSLSILIPNSMFLFLEKETFTLRSRFKTRTVFWKDIDRFKVFFVHGSIKGSIGYYYTIKYLNEQPRKKSEYITWYDGVIPVVFGLSSNQMMELLILYWNNGKIN